MKTVIQGAIVDFVPSFNAYLYFRIGYWIAKKVARLRPIGVVKG